VKKAFRVLHPLSNGTPESGSEDEDSEDFEEKEGDDVNEVDVEEEVAEPEAKRGFFTDEDLNQIHQPRKKKYSWPETSVIIKEYSKHNYNLQVPHGITNYLKGPAVLFELQKLSVIHPG